MGEFLGALPRTGETRFLRDCEGMFPDRGRRCRWTPHGCYHSREEPVAGPHFEKDEVPEEMHGAMTIAEPLLDSESERIRR